MNCQPRARQRLIKSFLESFDFSRKTLRGRPRTNSTASSPIATKPPEKRKPVRVKPPSVKKKAISKPTIRPLKSAGIRQVKTGREKSLALRSRYIVTAASRLATEPKIMSRGPSTAIDERLASTQPRVRPGTAAGVNSAKTVRASLARNWIAAEVDSGKSVAWSMVRTA